MNRRGVLALDVGSSRIKLGWYEGGAECDASKGMAPNGEPESAGGLPIAAALLRAPDETFQVLHRGEPSARWTVALAQWLTEIPHQRDALCVVSAVHPLAAATCAERLVALGWPQPVTLTCDALPIEISVTEPRRVGIDRLLGAVAVNRLRAPGEPSIVIDMGTAITVDLVDSEGRFSGGAILPGLALGASALHLGTASLPVVSVDAAPDRCVGRSTSEAIAAGLHWGTLGAVVEVARQIAREVGNDCQYFLTGGDAPRVLTAFRERFPRRSRHIPHLVLSGIYAVAATDAI